MSDGDERLRATQSSVLESRYRTLLRLLPRGYRTVREDEMVDTFLAGMRDGDPENFDLTLKHGRPSGAEIRSVVALAIRSRWGETVAPERFAVRTGSARIALLTAVTIFWAKSVVGLIDMVVALIAESSAADMYVNQWNLPLTYWQWWDAWAFMAWIPTLPLLVFGGRLAARWAVACAAVPTIVLIVRMAAIWPWGMNTSGMATLLLSLAVFGGLVVYAARGFGEIPIAARRAAQSSGAAVHESDTVSAAVAAGPRLRSYLWAGCAIVALFVAFSAAMSLAPENLFDGSPMGFWRGVLFGAMWIAGFDTGWWVIVAVAGGLILFARRRRQRSPIEWAAVTGGLALIAGIGVLLVAAWSVTMAPGSSVYGTPYLIVTALQLALTAGVFVAASLATARRFRALPAADPGCP